MVTSVTPALMFTGDAEAAMNFYVSLFLDAHIEFITRHDASGNDENGMVKVATFVLNGQRLLCMDSPVKHAFTFTPSTSLFIECDTEAEVDSLFEKLSAGGQTLMPLDSYPFAKRFGWFNDRFGVSWQLRFD